MKIARIVVLTIVLGAGGVAAYLARGTDTAVRSEPPPVAQLPTIEILTATASPSFIRRENGDGMKSVVGKTATLELKPDQAETLARARQTGTLQLALRSTVDVNAVERTSEEDALKRGESVKVVRYGVQSTTTTQK